MKKLFLLMLVMVITMGFVSAATLKVTKPVLDQRVTKGKVCSIKWIKTGTQNSNVKIKLFKSPSLIPVLDITSSTANNGSFNWQVPGSFETGKYTIRVTTLDNALFSYSKVFKIVKPGLKPGSLSGIKMIKVTEPVLNKLVKKGSSCSIKWIKTGTQDSNVKIKLCTSPGLAHVLDITSSTANDGSFSWQVPGGSGIGIGKYIIRVTTLDNALHSYSKAFRIVKPEPKPGLTEITVTEPVLNKRVKKGKVCSIKWIKTGTQNSNVKIKLFKSPSLIPVIDITNSTANDGSYSWQVPGNSETGKYTIRVTTLDNTLFSYSKVFKIVKPGLKPGSLSGLTEIKVTKPTTNALVDCGSTYTIKWETLAKQAFKIELWKYNKKKKFADIVTMLLIPGKNYGGKYSYKWNIPHNHPNAPGKRTIKITSVDGVFKGFSKPFNFRTVGAIQEKTVTLNPDSMKRRAKLTTKFYDTSGPTNPLNPEDHGLGKVDNQLRVGYSSRYHEGNEGRWWWWRMIFRSSFHFDLSQYTDDKVFLVEAKLKLKKKNTISTLSNNQNHCALGLWQLIAPWGNFYSSPVVHILNINQMGGAWYLDVTSKVREWTRTQGGRANDGFLITGINEAPGKVTEKCVTYFTAELILRYIEK